MLAAAYLLPDTWRPALALTNARRVATAPTVDHQDLTRCAVVALSAGDLDLAEELAERAARGDGDAVPVLATVRLRRGDREGVARLLDTVEDAGAQAAFWHRLVVEALGRGWFREALAARQKLRRSRLPAPHPLEVVVRGLPPALFGAVVLAAAVLAVVVPFAPMAAGSLAVAVGLAGTGVAVDLGDGRLASAAVGGACIAVALTAAVIRWTG